MNDPLYIALGASIGTALTTIIAGAIYILKSNADARKDAATARNTQQTTATDAVANTLAALITLLKDAIENLGKANEIASRERADTSTVLREMVEQIRAMTAVITDQGKSIVTVDERLTPVIPLLVTIGAQITALTSTGQANAAALTTLLSLFEAAMEQLKVLAASMEDVKIELKKANDKDSP